MESLEDSRVWVLGPEKRTDMKRKLERKHPLALLVNLVHSVHFSDPFLSFSDGLLISHVH